MTRPFWLEQALQQENQLGLIPAPALQGEIKVDVAIVGGGFTGLWTAIQTKQKNPQLDILIIEADVCGAGASGRNGGCMLTWATKLFTLERLYGAPEARRLVLESEAAVDHVAAFCREHQIDAEVRVDGTLYTASSAAQIGTLDPVLAALQRAGINSYQTLSREEVVRRSGSARNLAGVFSPHAGSVHPGKLVRGLRRVALAMGIRLHEHTPMQTLTPGHLVKLDTPDGRVLARQVVLATNAAMATLFPQFARSIVLVSSDMIITEPCPHLLQQSGLTDGIAVLDSRTFVHYYRSTRDGRLMLGKGGNTFAYGARMLPVFDQPSPYASQLRQALHSFFPQLAQVPVSATWNGASDRSVTGLPFFGRLNGAGKIFYGFGYSGNGVAPSHMGGQILSSLLLGEDNAWTRSRLCAGPLGQFPPEPLRYFGSIMVRNAIRRKEKAEDEIRQPGRIDTWLSGLAAAAGKADKGAG